MRRRNCTVSLIRWTNVRLRKHEECLNADSLQMLNIMFEASYKLGGVRDELLRDSLLSVMERGRTKAVEDQSNWMKRHLENLIKWDIHSDWRRTGLNTRWYYGSLDCGRRRWRLVFHSIVLLGFLFKQELSIHYRKRKREREEEELR